MRLIHNKISPLCMAAALMLSATGLQAAPGGVSVTASMDTTKLLMGQRSTLHLQVQKPVNSIGHFPLFANSDSREYATLLSDTVELSKAYSTDTVSVADGLARINYNVPIQVFDSGTYQLPPFQYVIEGDTVLSNRLSLSVIPVQAQATDQISGMTDVAEAAPGSWMDKLPDWVLQYWWAILASLLVLIALIWGGVRYFKARAKRPKVVKEISAYDEAMQALQALKGKQLWQNGDNMGYFIELTDILRRYIARRFGISAPEMTTTQFLQEAGTERSLQPYDAQLRRLLQLADFIKFAKGSSLPNENEEAFNIVSSLVQSTKEIPQAIEEGKEKSADAAGASKEGKEADK